MIPRNMCVNIRWRHGECVCAPCFFSPPSHLLISSFSVPLPRTATVVLVTQVWGRITGSLRPPHLPSVQAACWLFLSREGFSPFPPRRLACYCACNIHAIKALSAIDVVTQPSGWVNWMIGQLHWHNGPVEGSWCGVVGVCGEFGFFPYYVIFAIFHH